MSTGAELANQINNAAQHVRRAAAAVRREKPEYGPMLDEIERVVGEIAQDCTAGPVVTGAAPSESPRVDEHAPSQAALTGEGYHEADLVQADRFKQQSDVSEHVLREKGIAAEAPGDGFTVADVMTTDAGEYEEALEKTREAPAEVSRRPTDSVADVIAGGERLLELYRGRGQAAMKAEAMRRIGGLEAAMRWLCDAQSR